MNKTEILNALTAGFRAEFLSGLKAAEPSYKQIAMTVPSTTATNTYAWLSAFPKMREWVGTRTIKKLGTAAMAIENKLYEATVGIPRTEVEDDQVGIYRRVMQQAGQSAAELPDDLCWSLLPRGETTACYDGKMFFAADHPVYPNEDGTGTARKISNLTTGKDTSAPTWYVIDDTNALMPIVYQERAKPEFETKFDPSKSDKVFIEDVYLYGIRARANAGFGLWQLTHMVKDTVLSQKSISTTIQAMQAIKGNGGHLLNIRPSLLVVPPALEDEGLKILHAAVLDGSTNTYKGRLKLHVEPRL